MKEERRKEEELMRREKKEKKVVRVFDRVIPTGREECEVSLPNCPSSCF